MLKISPLSHSMSQRDETTAEISDLEEQTTQTLQQRSIKVVQLVGRFSPTLFQISVDQRWWVGKDLWSLNLWITKFCCRIWARGCEIWNLTGLNFERSIWQLDICLESVFPWTELNFPNLLSSTQVCLPTSCSQKVTTHERTHAQTDRGPVPLNQGCCWPLFEGQSPVGAASTRMEEGRGHPRGSKTARRRRYFTGRPVSWNWEFGIFPRIWILTEVNESHTRYVAAECCPSAQN